MMRKQISVLVTALILTLTGCAGIRNAPDTVSAPPVTETVTAENPDATEGLIYDAADNTWCTDDAALKKLADIMKAECARYTNEQCTRILATDDQIIFIAGLNATDIDGNPINAYTTYEIGSLTKMFTAACILQLCEQGKISLDDPVDRFFPEYERCRDFTVYDLLHMQAGLHYDFFPADYSTREDGSDDLEKVKKYYTDGYTDAELLHGLFSAEPICQPGTASNYSNSGYTLLAMIIEQVTGESYDKYVQDNIFSVCGMAHSASMKAGGLTSVPAPPEDNDEFDTAELFGSLFLQNIRTARGAGDIHSCAADMVAFDRALTGGKLLNEDSLAKMFDLQLDPDNPIGSMYDQDYDYGCGWELHPSRPTGMKVYYHSGDTFSYTSGNLYCVSETYGNLYLIQLYSARKPQTFDHMMHCDCSILEALKQSN